MKDNIAVNYYYYDLWWYRRVRIFMQIVMLFNIIMSLLHLLIYIYILRTRVEVISILVGILSL